ncbi:E3 ubiquitin-protein ligase SIAH1-like [Tenrec ecaudatus]|uniref:E3 ubiquitin-protein ligase SIAH1-like n=1 Tax=Tenrec ecaudatus TaxID=94439 RepID=UPI003F5A0EE9
MYEIHYCQNMTEDKNMQGFSEQTHERTQEVTHIKKYHNGVLEVESVPQPQRRAFGRLQQRCPHRSFPATTIPEAPAPTTQPPPRTRGPRRSIRNWAMENAAAFGLLPCRYAPSGCERTLTRPEKAGHEELCEFRPYSCPFPGVACKWQGSVDAVVPHLMHHQTPITTLQGADTVFLALDIDLPGAIDWVMIQSCFGFQFMIVLEKLERYEGNEPFFATVQLIGTPEQADNFAYRLELNSPGRRLAWEATPRSIHEGIATAILNSDCLVFDTTVAKLFAENGNLSMNVTISKC